VTVPASSRGRAVKRFHVKAGTQNPVHLQKCTGAGRGQSLRNTEVQVDGFPRVYRLSTLAERPSSKKGRDSKNRYTASLNKQVIGGALLKAHLEPVCMEFYLSGYCTLVSITGIVIYIHRARDGKEVQLVNNEQKAIEVARAMRAAQRSYFKDRTQSALAEAKRLEKELDRLLAEIPAHV
jgi:hypothetical protein